MLRDVRKDIVCNQVGVVLKLELRQVLFQVSNQVVGRFSSFNLNNNLVRAHPVVNLLRSDHLNTVRQDFGDGVSQYIDELCVAAADYYITIFLKTPECLNKLATLIFIEISRRLVKQHNARVVAR